MQWYILFIIPLTDRCEEETWRIWTTVSETEKVVPHTGDQAAEKACPELHQGKPWLSFGTFR